jgi:outer membrane protein TolC
MLASAEERTIELVPETPPAEAALAPAESVVDPVIPPGHVVVLDFPTALALVGGQHPVVGFAQWRVQEAYAQLARAEVLWLPSIRAGLSFHQHDGTLQGSNGSISDVNRSSFQAGLGAGAVAAGSTPVPGIIAHFHVSDALFQPRIAQKTAWARQHAATTALNDQLLRVALAYTSVLRAAQDISVLTESRQRTDELARLTRDFAESGQGLEADADRLATELILVDARLIEARESLAVATATLTEAVSLEVGCQVSLADPGLAPIALVPPGMDQPGLVCLGLSSRPELKENQCLVAAAQEQYLRQKYAPLVPSLLLGFSETGFGGGQGTTGNDFDDRYDVDALAVWEVRNLGFGERAARWEGTSRVEQSKFEQLRLLDRVAREVTENAALVPHRAERLTVTQEGIESARDSYDLNLRRIRDGQGLPLEVLQSIRALEEAQRAYLDAVADYNEAQFRLQWSLGWPVSAPW